MPQHELAAPEPRLSSQTVRYERPAANTNQTMTIGLVNNMPDAALLSTERQFTRLLHSGPHLHDVQIRLFYLPDIARGETARAQLAERYTSIESLPHAGIDALIVTGCEPVRPHISDEPYWGSLVELIDWAKHNTLSTIWSCLAAHAAVLHLDGVERRKLPRKRAGVYAFRQIADHPLLRGVPEPAQIPHSRLNGLSAFELAQHGYTILTQSDEAGVDAFLKDYGSLFVFLQGHPEYDADSLYREYRRDLIRYIEDSQDSCPSLPENYLDAKTAAALNAIAEEARAGATAGLVERMAAIDIRQSCRAEWPAQAARFFANWVGTVGQAKAQGRMQAAAPAGR